MKVIDLNDFYRPPYISTGSQNNMMNCYVTYYSIGSNIQVWQLDEINKETP